MNMNDDKRTMRWAMVLTAVASALLQLWRPLYHLTDDNLSGWLPAVTEFNRRLWQGQWPFISQGVFGGNFDLLADPGVLSVLSPFSLAFSWLSLTEYAYALVDVVSVCTTFCIAASFCWSALWLRRHFRLDTPRWLIVLLTLSFTFSPYNLFVGSAWLGFLSPQASLPLMIVGCLHPSARRGTLLQIGALLFSFFGGHAHTFVMLCLFSGVIGAAIAWHERRADPLLRVMVAGAVTAVLVLPVVWKAFANFSTSRRAAGLSASEGTTLRFELPLLLTTVLAGPIAALVSTHTLEQANDISRGLMSSGYSVVNFMFVMSIATMIRHKGIHRFTWVFVILLLVSGLFVTRPDWLAAGIAHIPVLRSLRWPFREVWIVVFSIHLLLLFEPKWLGPRERPALLSAGALVLGLLLLLPPPTLGAFTTDRRLLFSSVARQYWTEMQQRHGPVRGLVVGMDTIHVSPPRERIPFTLLGTHNFGSYFGFTSSMGYTFIPSIRRVSSEDPEQPYHPGGMFERADARAISRRHPGYWLVELESLSPPRWTVRTPRGRWRYQYDSSANVVRPMGVATD